MNIVHISDTHAAHDQLQLKLKGVDVLIHSGDESNYKDVGFNEVEFLLFVKWFWKQKVKHKILIPGNHSAYIYKNQEKAKEICKEKNITLLIDESITINGVKFYGAPYTEKFFNWYYMMDKEEIHKSFDKIPEDTNVLITHGPPYGILDLAPSPITGKIENAGSKALLERIEKLRKLKNLKLVCFGHIHNNLEYNINNQGKKKTGPTIYSNGSCVTDGVGTSYKFYITSNGNKIKI